MTLPSRSTDLHSPRGRVIVINNDRRKASSTAQWLCSLGWHASAAGNTAEGLQLLDRGRCDTCVVDGQLPSGGAEKILTYLRTKAPAAGIVVVNPLLLKKTVVDGRLPNVPLQADAWVTTPLGDSELIAAVEKAFLAGRERRLAQNLAAQTPAAVTLATAALGNVLGTHPAIGHVLDIVNRIANTPATVLITGESGTGKSLVARAIHQASARHAERFVEVACGSLSESLLESELFGHLAGSFTGATANRDGKFLQADRGTIFLDEIATASASMQVKLLRVLQDLRFEPVGGSQTHAVDARIILATHEDLQQLVAVGKFRADLFWRINVVTIEMPALRNRASDIPLLATHFLAAAVAKAGRRVDGFTAAALDAMLCHSWPGNVRELEHAIQRAVFLGGSQLIDVVDLPPAVKAGGHAPAASLKIALADPERQLIIDALDRHGWRRDAAARSLGINRTTLYKKIKRLGMDLATLEPAT